MADVEEIKKRLDIVTVISEYLTLKKSGVTLKALCPFHSEKTPSFTVSPERQSWHCFGCAEGGDVISFVQKIDGLSFTEALEKLAPKAGIELKPLKKEEIQARSDKHRITEVMAIVTQLYHELLLRHATAAPARDYLQKRGVNQDMIEKFHLGYAPEAWHTIEHALTRKSIELKWGYVAGLVVKQPKSTGYYDRFRGRLMFPIDEPAGQTIGFTGRVLEDKDDQPKYVNTSESPLFKKGEALYAISHARTAIRNNDMVVVVEGQMDVLTAHQFGFENTVATSGTALTAQHLRLLKRYTEHIAFALDADAAGLKAVRSASLLAWEAGLNPLIIRIPYGKDPDECIRHDAELWKTAVTNAQPALIFFLDQATAASSMTSLDKKAASKDIISLIKAVPNAVEQAEYIRLLAQRLNVPESSIRRDLGENEKPPTEVIAAEPAAPLDLDAERQTIGLLLAYFDQFPPLPAITFDNKALETIYTAFRQAQTNHQTTAEVINALPQQWKKRADTLLLETLRRHEQVEEVDTKQEILDCLHSLQNRARENRIHSNAQAIAAAYGSGDKTAARELLKSLEHDIVKGD